MDWNDDTIARLRGLWAEGLSTADIGRRLGVSKNAVVGKAHRLNLPPRPSPIRRDGAQAARPRNSQPRRVTGPTLPPLPASAASPTPDDADPIAAGAAGDLGQVADMEGAMPRPEAADHAPRVAAPAGEAKAAALRAVARRPARLVVCCWPLGEPGTKSFRFCDAEAAAGKPYCQPHAQLAYVRVRDRREDAA